MFKNLRDILTNSCEVIRLSDKEFFYPIFKNGSSSLRKYAKKNNLAVLINNDISTCEKVTVFLRCPVERFISGVYTFFYLKNKNLIKIDIDELTLRKIENFEIIDRHFIPQYLWLCHLHKYFNGFVQFKSVEELYELIPNRDGPWTDNAKPWNPIREEQKNKILSISHKKYTEIDKKIISKYMNQSIELKKIINEFRL